MDKVFINVLNFEKNSTPVKNNNAQMYVCMVLWIWEFEKKVKLLPLTLVWGTSRKYSFDFVHSIVHILIRRLEILFIYYTLLIAVQLAFIHMILKLMWISKLTFENIHWLTRFWFYASNVLSYFEIWDTIHFSFLKSIISVLIVLPLTYAKLMTISIISIHS